MGFITGIARGLQESIDTYSLFVVNLTDLLFSGKLKIIITKRTKKITRPVDILSLSQLYADTLYWKRR